MNKKILLLFFVFTLLVLTSCQGSSRIYNGPQTTDYFSGTEGLTAEFLKQAPPDEVFETSEFDVQLYMYNLGSFSLEPPYLAKIDLTYDTSKAITVDSYAQESNVLSSLFGGEVPTNAPRSKYLSLMGKSANWPTGQEDYLSLNRFKAKEIEGNFQTNTASFIAHICYPYETNFADEICIDTDTEGRSQRTEVCQKEDKTYSKGQGAPLAVTAVESQMIPRGVYVQPQFTIHLKHYGEGTIAYRDINDLSYSVDQCTDLDRDNINKISVKVTLAGDELNCLPNEIFLRGGEAKIQCQLTEDKILGVSSNYRTSLVVKAAYIHSESFRKDITIHKSEGTSFDREQSQTGSECFAWQAFDEEENKCVNTCDFKAKYDPGYIEFQKLTLLNNLIIAPELDDDYLFDHVTCSYKGVADCKINPDLCLLQDNLCPPETFCGMPACLLRNTPPVINDEVKVGLDKFSFFCTDSDELYDLDKRTCGCILQAKYGFAETAGDCNIDDTYIYTSQGKQTINGVRHEITGLEEENPAGKYLCVQVKDALNRTMERSFKYPYNT